MYQDLIIYYLMWSYEGAMVTVMEMSLPPIVMDTSGLFVMIVGDQKRLTL